MEHQAAAQQQLILELEHEDGALCEKWGMKLGTHAHMLCTLDLQEMREKDLKRALADMEVL
jgi:hypothetical protein